MKITKEKKIKINFLFMYFPISLAFAKLKLTSETMKAIVVPKGIPFSKNAIAKGIAAAPLPGKGVPNKIAKGTPKIPKNSTKESIESPGTKILIRTCKRIPKKIKNQISFITDKPS